MNFKFTYKKYAEALYHALCEDTFYLTMERSIGDDRFSKDIMLKYMDFSMVEAEKYGVLQSIRISNHYVFPRAYLGLRYWLILREPPPA